MSDVIVSEMTNGILLALFVLWKRENECSGVEQASKILQQFSQVPQFTSLSGHKGATTLSRCPSRLRNRDRVSELLEKCLSDKSEYPSLRQKLSDMLNIGNTHINSASTSTGIGLANAMVGLMALSGLMGRGEEPRNDKTNCDPCDSARLHAPVSQIKGSQIKGHLRAGGYDS
jgi:hypothetical protein